jgi:ubiquinone/menaquinone biosynthesis C-methylase UbiE
VGEGDSTWIKKKASDIPSTLWPDELFFKALKPNSRILDLGCGTGMLAVHLAKLGHDVTGVDLSVDAVDAANQLARSHLVEHRCRFQRGSAEALTFLGKHFDVAIMQAVLTTVTKVLGRRTILESARSVLRPEGILYMAEFAQTWHRPHYRDRYLRDESTTGELGLFIVHAEDGSELYRAKHFSERELVDLLIGAGFAIETFKHEKVKTRSGNIINGFQVIARPDPGSIRREATY